MIFTKPALTLDQQVEHLKNRGMRGESTLMRQRLASVNYYRLSAYWHTFRKDGGDTFLPGTEFEVVWARYVFDRELRLVVMDAIERVEVAVRSRLAYEHAHTSGPFGYIDDPNVVWAGRSAERQRFISRLAEALHANSHEPFVQHFQARYSDVHKYPPVWVAVEVLMFGDVVRLYRGSTHGVQRRVAEYFGVAVPVMSSWLLVLNVIRNLCAHHGRLWNRELGVKPKIPRHTDWERPVKVGPDRIFAVLTILAHAMDRIAPGSTWTSRVGDLIAANNNVPLFMMGFPENWRACPIWTAHPTAANTEFKP